LTKGRFTASLFLQKKTAGKTGGFYIQRKGEL